ncbi:NAD(P)/FAD-dependent oxidoreductase [Dongia deserti]|uniref:NAD(P)/FAD-dependent oxidoreductase n=1 Tax=Dongia deserti TaxID=2268030 RepID=UPI000E650F21|nr:FAD-binding oxidoreductase [Dongia deserti]
MGPVLDPVDSDSTVPQKVDVVVIGGGIAGVSTALFLARRGISVALCEKGVIGGEQSSRNWGWCRTIGRDLREVPLAMESLRLWAGMNALVEAETGFRPAGIAYLCDDAKELAGYESWLAKAEGQCRDYQHHARILPASGIDSLAPGAAKRYAGALHCASDGRAEPQKAAPAIANAARRFGANILTQCAVRGLDLAVGRIAGVITEKGRIACNAVVLAGGAWSRLFASTAGVTLPQLKVLSTVMRTNPVSGGPENALWAAGFGIRRRLDGGFTIANGSSSRADIVPDSFRFFAQFLPALKMEWKSLRIRVGKRFLDEWRQPGQLTPDRETVFERVRVLDPEPETWLNDRALATVQATFPALKGATIAQHWAGLIDVTPDAVPVISPAAQVPGFFIATGFSGHGFGIGPGAGRLMADLVSGEQPVVDPAPYRLSRFFDGSPIRFEAGL